MNDVIKKKISVTILVAIVTLQAVAQGATDDLQKANALYKQFKEPEALAAYQNVLSADPNNITALVKCTELSSSIGKKQADKNARERYFLQSKDFADKALAANPNSAEANYAESLAYANLSQIETENKKTVDDVKAIKQYADRGLSIDPNNAMLNYMEGKWHYELLDLNWFKKAALKALYGEGLAKPDIDSTIYYMEKCKRIAPYFVQNYFDLAQAYRMNKQPTKEIEVLSALVKLPNRTADDADLKQQAKKRLQELE